MAEIFDWDVLADNNNDAPPNGFPEGMAPSSLNNTAREVMAVLARYYEAEGGAIVSAGTLNAYTLTLNQSIPALTAGMSFTFRADRDNTGAATLNVNALGAFALNQIGGDALIAGQIVSGGSYTATYTGTEFRLRGSERASTLKVLYEGNADTNAFTDALLTKLNGIEDGAEVNPTAAEILTALLTVDVDDSTLNANFLQGIDASGFVRADAADTITGVLTFDAIPAFLGGTSGVNAPFTVDSTFLVNGLNADFLDGQHGTHYLAADNLTGSIPNGVVTASSVQQHVDKTYVDSLNIDADTLDSVQGADYVRRTIDQTITGFHRFENSSGARIDHPSASGSPLLGFSQANTVRGFVQYVNNNDIRIRNEVASTSLRIRNNATLEYRNGSLLEFLIDASANVHADGNIIAASTTTNSDARLKENILYLNPAYCLDNVLRLTPAQFNLKKRPEELMMGFIAQDVQATLPEAVKEIQGGIQQIEGSDTYLGINDNAIMANLAGAISALHDRLAYLESNLMLD